MQKSTDDKVSQKIYVLHWQDYQNVTLPWHVKHILSPSLLLPKKTQNKFLYWFFAMACIWNFGWRQGRKSSIIGRGGGRHIHIFVLCTSISLEVFWNNLVSLRINSCIKLVTSCQQLIVSLFSLTTWNRVFCASVLNLSFKSSQSFGKWTEIKHLLFELFGSYLVQSWNYPEVWKVEFFFVSTIINKVYHM